MTSFELKTTLPATSNTLYNAWLDSDTHSKMTGGEAVCSTKVGSEFSAWDGYISGKNVELKKNKEITQLWRTTEFSDADENSELTVLFNDVEEGCEMTIVHSRIPDGQPDYKQGWLDYYINPMMEYFNSLVSKREENLILYDKIIAANTRLERKGKSMPYTSANGYMFTLLNKDGEIGIRLSKQSCERFMKEHNTTIYKSYGAVMKDYVLVPEDVLKNDDLIQAYLNESLDYVMSLPPK